VLRSSVASVENGALTFDGVKVARKEWGSLRGRNIAMIFQDPLSYLNPIMNVGKQIAESVVRHDPEANKEKRVGDLLELVRLPRTLQASYPHELSGGMRQRVLIAIALGCRPKLLIADEPTTALDVTTQGEILDLLNSIRRELNMALMLITHDLSVVAAVTSRVNVMLRGQIVEHGETHQTLSAPMHPYTAGLFKSSKAERDENGRFITVEDILLGSSREMPQAAPFEKIQSERAVLSGETFGGSLTADHNHV
jgi:ABC-type dipeptide/oligopeptide/nickel transport system ATPase component